MKDITLPSGVILKWIGKDKFGGDVYQSNIWQVADIRLDPENYKLRGNKKVR